jgi:flavin-binding protein dodecin
MAFSVRGDGRARARWIGGITPWVGLGVLSVTAAVACDASEPDQGDEQFQTEETTVEVRFDVERVIFGSSPNSIQQACDAWIQEMKELSGEAAIEGHSCGEPKDVGGSFVELTATAVANVVAKLPPDTMPAEFSPVGVRGTGSTKQSWAEACRAELDHVRALYGDRFLAGTCDPPVQGSGSFVFYESGARVWIAPPKGTPMDLEGYAFGSSSSLTSWKQSCDDAIARAVELSGVERLGVYECGAPTQGSGSFVFFESVPRIQIAFPLVEGTEPELTEGGMAVGSSSSVLSWQAACASSLDEAKATHGERFLGGYCPKPTQASGSFVKYESPVFVWLGDLAKEPPPDEGEGGAGMGGSGGAPVFDDPSPAENCVARCEAKMEECNAGPVADTCAAMCTPDTTEGQLQCAEATECDHIGDWVSVCGLFQ